MADNHSELEKARPAQGDEADTIRRWSRGDDFHGGPNAKASIEGGFWIALIALLVAFLALWLAFHKNEQLVIAASDSRAAAVAAAERAERAETTTRLGREYIVTTFAEIQRELAVNGMSIEGPMGHHEPVPDKYYDQWDQYVAENIE